MFKSIPKMELILTSKTKVNVTNKRIMVSRFYDLILEYYRSVCYYTTPNNNADKIKNQSVHKESIK